MISVAKLEKLGGYKLCICFSDGSEGVHDFTVMVGEAGPMVEPLRDEAYFARVFLEFGAPTWPNGYDIAPAWLRREMAAAGELNVASSSIQAKRTPSAALSYHVMPSKEGRWAVRRAGATRSSGVFESQSEAIAWARDLVKSKHSELVVYGKDGRIRDRKSYGSDPAPPKDKASKSSSTTRGQKRA